MDFEIKGSLFAEMLSKISGAVGRPDTTEGSFALIFSGETLTAVAGCGGTSMSAEMPNIRKGEVKICVDAKRLLEILKLLHREVLKISIIEKSGEHILEIIGQGRYKLSCTDTSLFFMPKGDYDTPDNKEIILPSEVFRKSIDCVLFAAIDKEDIRPALTCVNLSTDEQGRICFVASNGQILASYTSGRLEGISPNISILIPQKALYLSRQISSIGGNVRIIYNAYRVFILYPDGTKIEAMRIDARYPDYKKIIRVSPPNRLYLNKSDFLSTLKRIRLYADESNRATIYLKENGGVCDIKSGHTEKRYNSEEGLNCEYTGIGINISFNAKMMNEIISELSKKIEGNHVSIGIESAQNAMIIRIVEDSNENKEEQESEREEAFALLMPFIN